ncbi:12-(S)-hydroxy-5,8,10,14-eicosatetraenoic acid receptor-like [Megalops cyprinoides]|uniref:12-(S)-hydroxy-5,8,10,14-eicosatetraenoic acid receptor-like n=1 Tax=Megalops cyprinoides TaxID=118141 RepID=UPI0018642869|nr:12-(S)-hydroxy-5,8,10,14-eicosatetraenoic acid receptor-like [Megalops cyprinoides]
MMQALENCTTENPTVYLFFSSFITVVFILALPLNLTILYTFVFKFRFWRDNILILNLVLADLLLLITSPMKIYNFSHNLRRSEDDATCKTMLFMLFLNRGASIVFLTVISIDRYFSVVHPRKKNLLKVMKKSPLISVLIWVLLLPLTVPTTLRTFECCNSHGRDEDNFTDTLREIVFFTQILIPFAILVFCTVQVVRRLKRKTVGNKTKLRRAVFLVTSVVLVFSVCFLPCTISRMTLLIARVNELHNVERIAVQFFDGFTCLSYMDCLLDPLVFCFCSTKFKNVYISNMANCAFLLKRKKPKDMRQVPTTCTLNQSAPSSTMS